MIKGEPKNKWNTEIRIKQPSQATGEENPAWGSSATLHKFQFE